MNAEVDHDLKGELKDERRALYHGSIAVCDDTGVVVIPKDDHSQRFLEKLEFIEHQEDIWYECIDRKKWSTYDTVCLKRYQDQTGD